mmetsp:Transcript_30596/g.61647  ORF Transcript_30596/g.61647 Transcript_30596/m.61647 type:complete len:301 (-) Transcript_30596:605-1507(-)
MVPVSNTQQCCSSSTSRPLNNRNTLCQTSLFLESLHQPLIPLKIIPNQVITRQGPPPRQILLLRGPNELLAPPKTILQLQQVVLTTRSFPIRHNLRHAARHGHYRQRGNIIIRQLSLGIGIPTRMKFHARHACVSIDLIPLHGQPAQIPTQKMTRLVPTNPLSQGFPLFLPPPSHLNGTGNQSGSGASHPDESNGDQRQEVAQRCAQIRGKKRQRQHREERRAEHDGHGEISEIFEFDVGLSSDVKALGRDLAVGTGFEVGERDGEGLEEAHHGVVAAGGGGAADGAFPEGELTGGDEGI